MHQAKTKTTILPRLHSKRTRKIIDRAETPLWAIWAAWELSTGPRCWLVDVRQPRTYEPMSGQRLETIGVRFSGPGLDAWLETLGGVGEFHFSDSTDFQFLEKSQQRLLWLVIHRRLFPELWTQCLLIQRERGVRPS
jgi:hypothetical protein